MIRRPYLPLTDRNKIILDFNLTERQKECIIMYFHDGLNMVDIADKLGLNKSTISRHIKWATKKIMKLNVFIYKIERQEFPNKMKKYGRRDRNDLRSSM